jgi:hypothetical protein
MPKAKYKTIDNYVSRIEAHLLRKFPGLQFDVLKFGDREATLLYAPTLQDVYPVIERASEIATEALVEGGYRIHVRPADEGPWARPSTDDTGSFPYWTTRNNTTNYLGIDDYIAEIERAPP